MSPPRIIERPHLRNLLLDSLDNGHILLTAPGGYGKSMALRDLERHFLHAHLVTITAADLDLSLLQAQILPLLAAPTLILLDDIHVLNGGVEVCAWLQQQLKQRKQQWILAGRSIPTEAHLFNYLTQAVFAQLPPQLKRFMQVTAVPLTFNLALAAHLWEDENEAASLLNDIIHADLYIQPTDQPGWYHYHDLIRDYLLEYFERLQDVATTAVAWFRTEGMVETAVDQAFDANLIALAAEQISQIPINHFHSNGSYLTYRRWVRALDAEAFDIDLMVLLQLGNALRLTPGYQDEGRDYCQRTLRLATERGNNHVRLFAQSNIAAWHYDQGELEIAHRHILAVLADPACQEHPRLYSLRVAKVNGHKFCSRATIR
ncbi:MAG: hypothetical protein GY805_02280 [Chloroflexi bacterium]|nr:hypothetical protein [Chloroflexota bacterium]